MTRDRGLQTRWLVCLTVMLGTSACSDDAVDGAADAQMDAGDPSDAGGEGDATQDLDAGRADATAPEDGGEPPDAADGGACETAIPTSSYHCLTCSPKLEGAPCGFVPTGATCSLASGCGEEEMCWRGGCYEASPTATSDGCVELWIDLDYGGVPPYETYALEVHVAPSPQSVEGRDIRCADGMEAENPIPGIYTYEDECQEGSAYGTCEGAFYGPVSLYMDRDGFHSQGMGDYTVHKVRGEGRSLGASWAGEETPLSIEATWATSSPSIPPPSTLRVAVFSTHDGCSRRVRYYALVGPEHENETAQPTVTDFCP